MKDRNYYVGIALLAAIFVATSAYQRMRETQKIRKLWTAPMQTIEGDFTPEPREARAQSKIY